MLKSVSLLLAEERNTDPRLLLIPIGICLICYWGARIQMRLRRNPRTAWGKAKVLRIEARGLRGREQRAAAAIRQQDAAKARAHKQSIRAAELAVKKAEVAAAAQRQIDRDAALQKIAFELEAQRLDRERDQAFQILNEAYERGVRDALMQVNQAEEERRRGGSY